MSTLEIAAAASLVLMAAAQTAVVLAFLAYCRRPVAATPDGELPQATVIVALRGRDPALEECLRGLFRQDYPRYNALLVVDSRDDPAWETAERAVRETGATHVRLRPLVERRTTCSLKCSAVAQAAAELEEACNIVAFLDSDVVPHPTWLRELAAPLADPRVGASMGNRWYMPRLARFGSIVRYLWNVVAVIDMYSWQVPWGGTLAVKATVLRQSELTRLWTRAGCDDVPLHRVLRKLRLRLVFVPSLMMVSYEECGMASCLRFIARQLTWVRLYHPVCWMMCTFFQTGFLAVQVLAGTLMLWAAWEGRPAAWGLAASLLGYYAVAVCLLAAVERHVRRVVARRGEVVPVRWWKAVLALPAAAALSVTAFARALFVRTIEWRQVRYEVRGPWKIRLVRDVPCTLGAAAPAEASPAGAAAPPGGRTAEVPG